jgi:hypothetical protein
MVFEPAPELNRTCGLLFGSWWKKQNGIDGTEGLRWFPQAWCFFGWIPVINICIYIYSIHVYIICMYIYIFFPLVIFVFLVYGPVFGWLKPNICKTSSQARTHVFAQHTINRCWPTQAGISCRQIPFLCGVEHTHQSQVLLGKYPYLGGSVQIFAGQKKVKPVCFCWL